MVFRSSYKLLALPALFALSLLSYGNAQVIPSVRSVAEFGSASVRCLQVARPTNCLEVSPFCLGKINQM